MWWEYGNANEARKEVCVQSIRVRIDYEQKEGVGRNFKIRS